MRPTVRQWMKVLLFAVFTALCCNSEMLAADNTHFQDAGRCKAECHCYDTEDQKNEAHIAQRHSALRFNAEDPTRTTIVAKPFSLRLVFFKIKNLFSFQRISFASYHGSDPKASHPITLLPQCDYFVFTLRHLLC